MRILRLHQMEISSHIISSGLSQLKLYPQAFSLLRKMYDAARNSNGSAIKNIPG
jgi:hypothetical protein